MRLWRARTMLSMCSFFLLPRKRAFADPPQPPRPKGTPLTPILRLPFALLDIKQPHTPTSPMQLARQAPNPKSPPPPFPNTSNPPLSTKGMPKHEAKCTQAIALSPSPLSESSSPASGPSSPAPGPSSPAAPAAAPVPSASPERCKLEQTWLGFRTPCYSYETRVM